MPPELGQFQCSKRTCPGNVPGKYIPLRGRRDIVEIRRCMSDELIRPSDGRNERVHLQRLLTLLTEWHCRRPVIQGSKVAEKIDLSLRKLRRTCP